MGKQWSQYVFCFLGGGAGSVAHRIDLQQWCLTVVKEQRKNTFVRTKKKLEHWNNMESEKDDPTVVIESKNLSFKLSAHHVLLQ